MSQRTLLVTGIGLMVAGFLLGAVVGPIVDDAGGRPTASQQLTPRYGGHHRDPGFMRPYGPGGGYYGNVPPRMPRPTPSPNA